jgi:hypothetical protein
MEIRDIRGITELRECIKFASEQYNDPLFPVDEKYFFRNMLQAIQSGASCKVIINNNEIVAWGCYIIAAPYPHSREKEVSQMYYQTKLKGFLAVKALRLYHRAMIKYALAKGIDKCATSSIMDTQETFYRILEKDGWIRRGCCMVYKISRNNSHQSSPRHRVLSDRLDRPIGKQDGTALPLN